jgi:signal transduction histidine kinase
MFLPETADPGIYVAPEMADIEIFADPMLQTVFYNLCDNAIRHGVHVTEIRIYPHITPEGLIIICEDNGVGIPIPEKERIFGRGYGKNTGFGLFLVREILGITGITIQETGEPGKGARFEMVVPPGNFHMQGGE